MKLHIVGVLVTALVFTTELGRAQESGSEAAEVARKLSNPVAAMISMPLQNNMDVGIGSFNGSRNTLNFQPVVPISITQNLNLIARMIMPIMVQHDVTGQGTSQSGLSDGTFSGFFSPVPEEGGVIWGAGPAFLVPTATEEILGTKKFGVGPTGLILKQTSGWTYGALVNQIWSIAGDDSRPDVNQLFIQPFFAYNWKSGGGLSANVEITQNWEANTTTAFFNPVVTGVTKLGGQTVSLAAGPRICLDAPEESKPDFGIRSVVTLVFAK